MRAAVFLLLFVLAACGRPLSAPESDLATRLFGPSLNTDRVRVAQSGLIGTVRRQIPVRPRTTCRERILPPATSDVITTRVAGMVLGSRITVRPDLFLPDYAQTASGRMNLIAAMFLSHELTHVWQWQNRGVTGYSPLRVGREHFVGDDPYLFDVDESRRFLDYGYEQQASLVEEYVCCSALDPEGARTDRLRALLTQVIDPGALPSRETFVPWDGVQTRGICS